MANRLRSDRPLVQHIHIVCTHNRLDAQGQDLVFEVECKGVSKESVMEAVLRRCPSVQL